jgi:hypothetical protein
MSADLKAKQRGQSLDRRLATAQAALLAGSRLTLESA